MYCDGTAPSSFLLYVGSVQRVFLHLNNEYICSEKLTIVLL